MLQSSLVKHRRGGGDLLKATSQEVWKFPAVSSGLTLPSAGWAEENRCSGPKPRDRLHRPDEMIQELIRVQFSIYRK